MTYTKEPLPKACINCVHCVRDNINGAVRCRCDAAITADARRAIDSREVYTRYCAAWMHDHRRVYWDDRLTQARPRLYTG